MSYYPMNYEKINLYTGLNKPSSMKARNNRSFWFWERALFQRAISTLKFDGFPEEWSGERKDFILYVLFMYGFGVVTELPEYGLVFQPCGLKGYDFYYQPTQALIANPALKGSVVVDLHKNAELIKLTPDYFGAWDIIDYYAEKLSLMDNSINTNLVNSKFSWILGAKNRSVASALKKVLDLINQGEPAVVFNNRILDDANSKGTPFQYLDLGNPKDRYLGTELLQDFATIINQFDTEIGIPTLPYQKKERMVVDESNSKKVESIARVTTWMNTLEESFKQVNEMFGTDLSVSLRFMEEFEQMNQSTGNGGVVNE